MSSARIAILAISSLNFWNPALLVRAERRRLLRHVEHGIGEPVHSVRGELQELRLGFPGGSAPGGFDRGTDMVFILYKYPGHGRAPT